MSNIFSRDRGTHWYKPDGTPCHTQPDGKQTTLRHARKQGLLPSVTNILSILPKYAVEDWRVEQAVLATMNCMVQPGASALTAVEMMNEVRDRLDETTSAGRKFGTEFHQVADYINRNRSTPPELSPLGGTHRKHAEAYLNWLKVSGLTISEVETPFVSQYASLRYAGTKDISGTLTEGGFISPCVADIKTQAIRNGKPAFYDEWSYQLAAYSMDMPANTKHLSIVVDSGPDAAIHTYVWSAVEIDKARQVFFAAYNLWSAVKVYRP